MDSFSLGRSVTDDLSDLYGSDIESGYEFGCSDVFCAGFISLRGEICGGADVRDAVNDAARVSDDTARVSDDLLLNTSKTVDECQSMKTCDDLTSSLTQADSASRLPHSVSTNIRTSDLDETYLHAEDSQEQPVIFQLNSKKIGQAKAAKTETASLDFINYSLKCDGSPTQSGESASSNDLSIFYSTCETFQQSSSTKSFSTEASCDNIDDLCSMIDGANSSRPNDSYLVNLIKPLIQHGLPKLCPRHPCNALNDSTNSVRDTDTCSDFLLADFESLCNSTFSTDEATSTSTQDCDTIGNDINPSPFSSQISDSPVDRQCISTTSTLLEDNRTNHLLLEPLTPLNCDLNQTLDSSCGEIVNNVTPSVQELNTIVLTKSGSIDLVKSDSRLHRDLSSSCSPVDSNSNDCRLDCLMDDTSTNDETLTSLDSLTDTINQETSDCDCSKDQPRNSNKQCVDKNEKSKTAAKLIKAYKRFQSKVVNNNSSKNRLKMRQNQSADMSSDTNSMDGIGSLSSDEPSSVSKQEEKTSVTSHDNTITTILLSDDDDVMVQSIELNKSSVIMIDDDDDDDDDCVAISYNVTKSNVGTTKLSSDSGSSLFDVSSHGIDSLTSSSGNDQTLYHSARTRGSSGVYKASTVRSADVSGASRSAILPAYQSVSVTKRSLSSSAVVDNASSSIKRQRLTADSHHAKLMSSNSDVAHGSSMGSSVSVEGSSQAFDVILKPDDINNGNMDNQDALKLNLFDSVLDVLQTSKHKETSSTSATIFPESSKGKNISPSTDSDSLLPLKKRQITSDDNLYGWDPWDFSMPVDDPWMDYNMMADSKPSVDNSHGSVTVSSNNGMSDSIQNFLDHVIRNRRDTNTFTVFDLYPYVSKLMSPSDPSTSVPDSQNISSMSRQQIEALLSRALEKQESRFYLIALMVCRDTLQLEHDADTWINERLQHLMLFLVKPSRTTSGAASNSGQVSVLLMLKCCTCGDVGPDSIMSLCNKLCPCCAKCMNARVKPILSTDVKEALVCGEKNCGESYVRRQLLYTVPEVIIEIMEERKTSSSTVTHSLSLADDLTSSSLVTSASSSTTASNKESGAGVDSVPAFWDSLGTDEDYYLVRVDTDSNEFYWISARFSDTMKSSTITRILRVQNTILWQYYQIKKKEMDRHKTGKYLKEKNLFHGTWSENVQSICTNNFDWRLSGKNAVFYGDGSYFARDASYSHKYTNVQSSGKMSHKGKNPVRRLSSRLIPSASGGLSNPVAHNPVSFLSGISSQPANNCSWCSLPSGVDGCPIHKRSTASTNSFQSPVTYQFFFGDNTVNNNTTQSSTSTTVSANNSSMWKRLFTDASSRSQGLGQNDVTAAVGSGILDLSSGSTSVSGASSSFVSGNNGTYSGNLGLGNLGSGFSGNLSGLKSNSASLGSGNVSSASGINNFSYSGTGNVSISYSIWNKDGGLLSAGNNYNNASNVQNSANIGLNYYNGINWSSGNRDINSAGLGLNNARLGLNSASHSLNGGTNALNNGNLGLNNASIGLNNASIGLNNASIGFNNASIGLNNASNVWNGSRSILNSQVNGLNSSSYVINSSSSTPTNLLPPNSNDSVADRNAEIQQIKLDFVNNVPKPCLFNPLTLPFTSGNWASRAQRAWAPLVDSSGLDESEDSTQDDQSVLTASMEYKSTLRDGTRVMFLAKVLVGESTQGQKGYRRPPPLDPTKPYAKCYDSCVDNVKDPSIFVVFDNAQYYPEYIIEYCDISPN